METEGGTVAALELAILPVTLLSPKALYGWKNEWARHGLCNSWTSLSAGEQGSCQPLSPKNTPWT